MIKYVTVILLAFLVAETISATSCPLGDLELVEQISKLNGNWTEYQKTTDFLTKITCFTYNFKCPNDTNCDVDMIQKDTIKETNALAQIETDITWGTQKVYINLDTDSKYAILWNCEEQDTNYQLAILLKNVTDETVTKKIKDILKDIKVTYKSEPKIIDYKACSDATMFTISLGVMLIATFTSLL